MRRELALLLLGACSKGRGPDKPPAPALVAHPAGETEQAVVTLTTEGERRLGIATAKVEKSTLKQRRVAPAEIVVPSGSQTALLAPFAAIVRPVSELPKVGDAVLRNQRLLRLSPLATIDRDVHAQSEKALAIAESRLESAQQKLDRLEKLRTEGAASDKQVEEARADRDALVAEVAAARKRLATLKGTPLSGDVSADLLAPYDGVVLLSPVTVGQLVPAGATLIEVLRKSGFWVKVSVLTGEAATVRTEAPAQIQSLFGGSGATVEAEPVLAAPTADPTLGTVHLYFELPKTATRRPGEKVTASLELLADEEVTTVPAAAVVYDAAGGAWVYEKTRPHTFARRRVDVRRTTGATVVLTRSPPVGTEVVSIGVAQLFGVEFGAGH